MIILPGRSSSWSASDPLSALLSAMSGESDCGIWQHDMETWQETAQTTAAGVGDDVGSWGDLLNANDFDQGTASLEPPRASTGIDFTVTSGERLDCGTFTMANLSSATVLMKIKVNASATVEVPLCPDDGAGRFVGVLNDSSVATPHASAGSPTYIAAGTSCTTRGDIYAAMQTGSFEVLEVHGADFSGWSGFRLGYYNPFAGGSLRSLCSGLIICTGSQYSTYQTEIDDWMAAL